MLKRGLKPHKGSPEAREQLGCRVLQGFEISACGAGGAGLLGAPGQAEASGAVQGLVHAGHRQHALAELHAARRQGQGCAGRCAGGVRGRDALHAWSCQRQNLAEQLLGLKEGCS